MKKLNISVLLIATFCLCCFRHQCEADDKLPFECDRKDCTSECKYGFVKDEHGCNTCECSYPCESMICPLGSNCSSILINDTGTYQHKCLDANGDVMCVSLQMPVTCMIHCEYGLVKDEDDCDICKCHDPCNDVTCQAGFKCVVNNETKAGECRTDLKDKCSEVMCKMGCEFGFIVDDKGCPICACYWPCLNISCPADSRCIEMKRDNMTYFGTCKPFPLDFSCPLLNCSNLRDVKCEYGHVKDIHGCDTCNCNEPCSGIPCDLGKVCTPQRIDNTSVFVGKCFDNPACLDEPCDFYCEFGYVTSIDNCKICACVDPCQGVNCSSPFKCRPKTTQSLNGLKYVGECTDEASTACTKNTCNETCEYGYKLDSIGCPTCACHDPCSVCAQGSPCQPDKLGILHNDYDARCPTSSSSSSSTTTTTTTSTTTTSTTTTSTKSPADCPRLNCALNCTYGYTTDENQCLQCQCATDPCVGFNCATRSTCLLEKTGENKFIGKCKQCPGIQCNNECELGYKKTTQGCDTCDCYINPCDVIDCEFGSKCVILDVITGAAECKVIDNPCMERECRLECAGHGELNRYKLNCSQCSCDDPCFTSDCQGNMCISNRIKIKAGGKDVAIVEGRCDDSEKCPPLNCDQVCENGTMKDKYGCQSCRCSDGCDKKICKSNQHCTSQKRLTKVGDIFKLVGYKVEYEDCPQFQCAIDMCLYGYKDCSSCDCANNPCLLATTYENKLCLPLYFPIYAQSDERLNPKQNHYQDYVYLDVDSTNKCEIMNKRYLDNFNISEPLNCKQSGNEFKTLQCFGGKCWCLNAADGGGPVETQSVNDVICDYHSKEFLSLKTNDDISQVPDGLLKRSISASVSASIGVSDDQVIVLNIADKNTAPTAHLVYFTRSDAESANALQSVKEISRTPLNVSIEGMIFRFTIDPKSTLSATPSTPFSTPSPTPLTSTPPRHVEPTWGHNNPLDEEHQDDMTRFYLLVILLPILVVLFVVLLSVIIGILVLKKLNKRSGPPSLFKEPIIFQESPRNSYPYETTHGSEA